MTAVTRYCTWLLRGATDHHRRTPRPGAVRPRRRRSRRCGPGPRGRRRAPRACRRRSCPVRAASMAAATTVVDLVVGDDAARRRTFGTSSISVLAARGRSRSARPGDRSPSTSVTVAPPAPASIAAADDVGEPERLDDGDDELHSCRQTRRRPRPPRGGSRGPGRCGSPAPAGASRRRSRRTCTSRAFRPGTPSGQPARPRASRLTTAPYRSSMASVRRASTGGSDTHPRAEPQHAVVVEHRARAGGGPASRRSSASTRACRSTSSAGTRIQSSSSSVTAGGRASPSTSSSRGRPAAAALARAQRSSEGHRTRTTSTASERTEALFRDCFAPVNRPRPCSPATGRLGPVRGDNGEGAFDGGQRRVPRPPRGSIALFSALSRKELERVGPSRPTRSR